MGANIVVLTVVGYCIFTWFFLFDNAIPRKVKKILPGKESRCLIEFECGAIFKKTGNSWYNMANGKKHYMHSYKGLDRIVFLYEEGVDPVGRRFWV